MLHHNFQWRIEVHVKWFFVRNTHLSPSSRIVQQDPAISRQVVISKLHIYTIVKDVFA
jgi:hypothetical protein